ncbi:hypothetical protein GCM10007858_73590 [Bradyrhizobium liaoningense]|jgi:hypothetical protein|nr:hypothetical protein GCM10007858_73590 [Bradyrhizobium liaoningense]
MIVTENLKDFPATVLPDLNMEVKSADAFIADTTLDEAREPLQPFGVCANASKNRT